MAVDSSNVLIYSSGVLTLATDYSESAAIVSGGDDRMVVLSGGTVTETNVSSGGVLEVSSGAVISGINVNGGMYSGYAYCSGNEKWYGPGICATNGSVILENAEFLNNSAATLNGYAGQGGAIETYHAELRISGGTFASNVAMDGGGGAVLAIGGSAVFSGVCFSGNFAAYGGAVEAAQSAVLGVDGAVFSGNSAIAGGAVAAHAGAEIRLENSVLNGNAASAGGAVFADSASDAQSVANLVHNTISGNTASSGGAIFNSGAAVTVAGGEMTANRALLGGAGYLAAGTLEMSGTLLSGNVAGYDSSTSCGGFGGALYNGAGASAMLTAVELVGNSAEYDAANAWNGGCGGAIANYGGLSITGGSFSSNSTEYGGGIYQCAGDAGTVTVREVSFDGNSALYGGGAICNCYGALTVSGGSFSNNSAANNDGGAIANWSNAAVTGAAFNGNKAAVGGAISNAWAQSLTVSGCVFAGNSAGQGGAIYQDSGSGSATLTDCTFNGNLSDDGGAIYNASRMTLTDCGFSAATDTIVNSGTLILAGANSFAGTVDNAGTVVISLMGNTPESSAVIDDLSKFSGGNYTLSLSSPENNESYRIADSASLWSGNISLSVDGTDSGSAFALTNGKIDSGSISYDGSTYTLSLTDGALSVTVMESKDSEFLSGNFAGGGVDLAARTRSEALTLYRNGAGWVEKSLAGGWSAAATGDFNFDGGDDFLLYHAKSGTVGAWTMNSDGSNGWMSIGNPLDSSWEIRGAGDFDSSGTSDVLLYWKEANYLGSWNLSADGTAEWHGITQLSPGWETAGIGDYNGDGADDILLYHAESGTAGAYLMNADGSFEWKTVGNFDSSWKIAGTGDFNGDGTDDILLGNSDYSCQGAWLLNSRAEQSGWASLGQFDTSAWSVAGTGDYNGDGTDDILFAAVGSDSLGARLVSNGAVGGWLTVA